MAQFPLEWDLGRDGVGGKAVSIAFAVTGFARQLIDTIMPDLASEFPFNRGFEARAEVSDNSWIAVRIHWQQGRDIPMTGRIGNQADLRHLNQCVASVDFNSGQALNALGADWMGFDKFTYVGPIAGNNASWQHVQSQVADWLGNVIIPHVQDLNKQRVLRAVPQAPTFVPQTLFPALWVLECEEAMRQGTAFALDGVGLVTCDHVLGPKTSAFRYDEPEKRYAIRVLRRNSVVDLAVIALEGTAPASTLKRGVSGQMQQMDHILLMGHPNFRLGDTPNAIPGLVVGFRIVSSVRRFLTNAPIVAGTSGGPVVNGASEVVGVAVTGVDAMSIVQTTENHGIIPIDALDFL